MTVDSNFATAPDEALMRQNVSVYLTVRKLAFSVSLLTVVLLAGCSFVPLGQDARAAADTIATRVGMRAAFESAGDFELLTYRRGIDTAAGPVHVYVEGDGRAWRGRRAPRNPTPYSPLGLRLAAKDPAPAVLWIARPCMYLPQLAADRCDPRWWTSHRYATEVVGAMNSVVSRVVGAHGVTLIGHSGGGALATLIASRRNDVVELITIGAPLDLGFWTAQGKMTPLHGSLDPIDVAHLLAELPQRHLAGDHDRVVPSEVIRRFVSAVPLPNHARLEVQRGRTHRCCWEREWPQLLCKGGSACEGIEKYRAD